MQQVLVQTIHLLITAVASQTSFTVSEAVTIATNIDLLFAADGGEEITG